MGNKGLAVFISSIIIMGLIVTLFIIRTQSIPISPQNDKPLITDSSYFWHDGMPCVIFTFANVNSTDNGLKDISMGVSCNWALWNYGIPSENNPAVVPTPIE